MGRKIILNALRLERVGERSQEGLIPIEGYICHFNKPNLNGEIYDEASFAWWLSELEKGGVMPALNYNHTDLIIGGWDRFESDSVGMKGYGHLNANSAQVRDNILPLVESGDVNRLSTEGWNDWNFIEERGENLYMGRFTMTAVSLVGFPPADFGAEMKTIKNQYQEWKKTHTKPNRVVTIY